MTGKPNFNHEEFDKWEISLQREGHHVLNPAKQYYRVQGLDLTRYLQRDLIELLFSDAIALIPGWENSKGARVECLVALKTGKKIIALPGASHPELLNVRVEVL
jgi:hypothetical protein